jgi:tRNA pseudouridine55 synthase
MLMGMFGLFNINKPSGITSRDAVDCVVRIVKPDKVGHAGTLDPLASGVLVVCVGRATRLAEYVQRMRKEYTATYQLGRTSDTDDIEGAVVELADAPVPSRQAVEQALGGFVGDIQQRPPVYSAVKLAGQRAYARARRGESVELAPRTVSVYEIRLVEYEYPKLVLDVTCGAGTYLRSLGRDLGQTLGSGAVMSALVRTAIGDFTIDEACPLEALTPDTVAQWLLPPTRAVAELPQVQLTADEERHVLMGRMIARPGIAPAPEYAALSEAGELVAILVPRGSDRLGPVRVFAG